MNDPNTGAAAPTNDEKQARLLGMLCHLLALAGYVVPFGNIFGPLIIWLIKRQEIPFVDEQGKESLNFQISLTIYTIVALLLCLVIVGFFLLLGIVIFNLVMVIIASVRANDGVSYRYPLTIRFIK